MHEIPIRFSNHLECQNGTASINQCDPNRVRMLHHRIGDKQEMPLKVLLFHFDVWQNAEPFKATEFVDLSVFP